MYKRWLPLLLLLCLTAAPALADDTAYAILYPSLNESRIVPARDFYVIAQIPADAETGAVRLLDAEGMVVRALTGGVNPAFCLDYPALNAFNTDHDDFLMPDLIYDPLDPDSLYNGAIKCYIKDGYLFAVIAGGQYEMDGRAISDADGKPYARLAAGEYTLEVEAGGVLLTSNITLGVTEDKVMSRFSPDGHMTSVTAAASENEYRVYKNPLPGYWSPSSFLPGQEANPYFAEIKDRWQLADAMEYMSGTVHFYVYNLSPTSATLSVELAALQLDGAVDVRMRPYHYDIGEPLLAYADAQTDAYLMGAFVPFAQGDKLVVTRGEVTDEATENYYVAYTGDRRPIDLNVYDGTSVPAGKALTLYGVVCPIQNDLNDMTRTGGSAWTTGNRVEEIEYIFAAGNTVWRERHEVLLTRMLAEGWRGDSLYEFAHSFVFDASLAGQTVTVILQGYDSHGSMVDGTSEAFVVTVE